MRMRPEQKQAARAALVRSAGRRFRREGMAGIGIDGLAKESGQTSGAVYAHFGSKAELFAAVIEEGLERLLASAQAHRANGGDLAGFAVRYLSQQHRDAVEDGCLLPALSADVARSEEATRARFAEGLAEIARTLADGDEAQRRQALAILALCAGGVLLARAVSDSALSETLLSACRDLASAVPPA